MKAVLLLSGGLDSYTAGALARRDGYELYALTVRYGQVHERELAAARDVAKNLRVMRHIELTVDLAAFGGSALVGEGAIPKDRDLDGPGIPSTYVPARNTIFLSFALALAEVIDAADIFIGVNALDYSGYPDCRPEYVAAYERMANLATRGGVEGTRPVHIRTPLIDLTKRQIIELGRSLGVNYAMTTSCYDPAPDGAACGHCDACLLRLKGFAEAGLQDPARYADGARSRSAATP
jgi:7-cyano-7-deazaguanine synthase